MRTLKPSQVCRGEITLLLLFTSWTSGLQLQITFARRVGSALQYQNTMQFADSPQHRHG